MTELEQVSRILDFLYRVSRGIPLRPADREEDRIRQKARAMGLAKVEMNPRRWVVTDIGQCALAKETPE